LIVLTLVVLISFVDDVNAGSCSTTKGTNIDEQVRPTNAPTLVHNKDIFFTIGFMLVA